MGFSNVLFDLDGTLTDSALGITRCIVHALTELGYPEPDAESLRLCLGPPIQQSFARLLSTDDGELIRKAVALYRERFAPVGKFENEVYDGVPEMLEAVRRLGLRIAVATAKPENFAKEIVEHFGLDEWVKDVYGSELDGRRGTKTEIVRYALDSLGIAGEDTIMVGDREHDVIGSRANDVPCIGVTYGYGTVDELRSADAVALASSPAEVVKAIELLGGFRSSRVSSDHA